MDVNDVDVSFLNGKRKSVATVGELRNELAALPDDMPFVGTYGNRLVVSVFNPEGGNPRCEIDECDDDEVLCVG